MYGFVGLADSPSPWSMMWRSSAAVSFDATPFSAGTSGETPPRPFSPWHWAQAKVAKSWAPAATWGSTVVAAAVVAATAEGGVDERVARPTTQPPTAKMKARPSATRTIAASATCGARFLRFPSIHRR
jgi:hypothetical protein